jgi:hypothetical protein
MPFVNHCHTPQSSVLAQRERRSPSPAKDRLTRRSKADSAQAAPYTGSHLAAFAAWYVCLLVLLTVSAILV